MSNFKVEIMTIDGVERHPDADRLDVVTIRGYKSISARLEDGSSRYKTGDTVAYIPEAAILPDNLLKVMGFWKNNTGTLSGKHGNRVKAMRLRGVLSQGLLYPVNQETQRISGPYGNTRFVMIGDDVSEFLEITKYEPPVPVAMSGEVVALHGKTLKYDIENIQKFPNVFRLGEPVEFTEKLHGTFCALAYWPGLGHKDLLDGDFFAFSKGLGAQGLVFKDNERNANNIYQRTLRENKDKLKKLAESFVSNLAVYVLGEVYGKGIQDLTYGESKPKFRVFDVYVRDLTNGDGRYHRAQSLLGTSGFEGVPVLYLGEYSPELIDHFTNGQTEIVDSTDTPTNIREGIVIRPIVDTGEEDPLIGRRILKSVSAEYLTRKNGTEYN